jgi:hypothetical protein
MKTSIRSLLDAKNAQAFYDITFKLAQGQQRRGR